MLPLLSPGKKNALLSLIMGTLFALLFGGGTAYYLFQKRADNWDTLNNDINSYVDNLFQTILRTSTNLQPLTFSTCAQASRTLTSSAAFGLNIRALALVTNGIAWCSSANGEIKVNLAKVAPGMDLSQKVNADILPGTPMMPNRPTIVLWNRHPDDPTRGIFISLNVNLNPYLLYTSRQRDVYGIAIAIHGKILSTFSPRVMSARALDLPPIRRSQLHGLPVEIRLYGTPWSREDIQLAILFGLFGGVIFGLLTTWSLNSRSRTGLDIQTGIRREQFFAVYQPVINARDQKMAGLEVLMRWKHPVNGLISPDVFISYAEDQQLVASLTRHLFSLVINDIEALQSVLPPSGKLGINLAPSHLHSPDFKQDILNFARALPPHSFNIVFEITERTMLNEAQALPLFEWLHEQGFEIAIDDFGTGHSALIYLQRFKMDYLKIDRGFISAIGTDTVTTPVLDAVLILARRLNMNTVAEGVETAQQAQWLIDQGVNYLQGYYYSRPLTAEALVEWSRQYAKGVTL
ncbi:cyclic di-GMP phosphodiesterase [Shimwellia pseudoproteus]|uniref:cyclic di-GMP phosphodiesterase n=1 Tax=Shimwellia pseudoproteus TaxID=570012 RepID=UPI0018ECA9CE|nr:cyclic di-GMP phosphodiesterase [Shimwellia pseudoproteus]MBJ3816407.1 cyclic di-GMP phosphodiesterase [Shimwellia pseudoproteus]